MPLRAPFGIYAPDLPALGNPGSVLALNVTPDAGGYRPFRELVTYSDALDDRCQGAFFTTDADNNVFGFAGDRAKLYALSGGNTQWQDVSRPAGYNTPVSGRWASTKFGNDVLMSNFADPPQAYTIGSSATFDDLAGGPPKAKHMAVISNFVVLGFLDEGGAGVFPSRIRWSAFEDATSWPAIGSDAARAVQSDQQNLLGDGGWVQALVGGLSAANGAILQERALWRMIYVDAPVVFQIDQVEGGRGTPAPGSIGQVGGTIFYLGEDGFYRFDGQSSVPIGANKVDRTFFDTVDTLYYDRVTTAVDPVRKLVIWGYPSKGKEGRVDRQLIYNWSIDQWSPGDQEVEIYSRSMTFGIDLDTDLNADETLADDDSWPSLDSRFWSGGRPGLSAFDTSHRLAFVSGAPREAVFETGEFELQTGHDALLNRVWPLVDQNGAGAAVEAAVRSRYQLGAAPSVGQFYAMNSNGYCYARSRGRYHRILVRIPAGYEWQHAQGADVAGLVMEGA